MCVSWGVAVAISQEDNGTTLLSMAFWGAFIIFFWALIIYWIDNEETNRSDYALTWWQYLRIYRSNDQCMKDWKIIEVYE